MGQPLPSPTHLGIVVARFTEPLTPWAPFASNTYLYAKFPTPQASDSTPHSSFRSYTQLPNTSREGQTYLHHIVTHYDSLDDITIFTQANPFDIISPVTTTVSEMVEKSLSTPIDDVTIFNPSSTTSRSGTRSTGPIPTRRCGLRPLRSRP
jgi:hypothetical protein